MQEDKLTHRQRVRLEALAQTHIGAGLHFDHKPTSQEIFDKAEEIEAWLLNADRGIN